MHNQPRQPNSPSGEDHRIHTPVRSVPPIRRNERLACRKVGPPRSRLSLSLSGIRGTRALARGADGSRNLHTQFSVQAAQHTPGHVEWANFAWADYLGRHIFEIAALSSRQWYICPMAVRAVRLGL